MMCTSLIKRLALGCLICFSMLVSMVGNHAMAREEGAPAAALGLGDAVRATAVGTSGLYFNPAGMGLVNQYAVEAGYSFSGDGSGHALGASAVDSRTNGALAMGVAYAFLLGNDNGYERDGHQVRAALAAGHQWEGFAIRAGVGGRYLNLDRAKLNDFHFFTLDAGLVLEIVGMFRIAAVGHNLIDTKSSESPRSIGFGAAVSLSALQLSFDAELDMQTDPNDLLPRYGVGLQYLFGGVIVARAGFGMGGRIDQQDLSMGLGYVSQMLAGDVSFSKRIDGPDGMVLSLAFRYFLP
jgi:hypothetical protein